MRDFNDDREQMEFLRKYNERQYERRKKMRKRLRRVNTIVELISNRNNSNGNTLFSVEVISGKV